MAELEPVDESWTRALCVVAHPDDLEFGAAAAVARWTDQGKTVVYAMVTSGEAGIDGLHPDEARRVREAEQVESARIVGVDSVEFLGLPDGVLEYGVGLRRAICAVVRKYRPEIVITNNFRDTWGGQASTGRSHRDRQGHARRGPGRRQPLDLQRAARSTASNRGVEWGRSGRPARRTDGTGSRRRRPSIAASRRWLPTRPTSTASAGRTSIPRSSSRVARGRPGPGSAFRWRPASRCSPWVGATEPQRTDTNHRALSLSKGKMTVSRFDRLRTRNRADPGLAVVATGARWSLTNCHRPGVPLDLFEHAF